MNNNLHEGQLIADKIRKTLLQIDLKLLEADAQCRVADEEFKLNQKIKKTLNQKKAMESKIKRECYKVYINNLKVAKSSILDNLNKVLSTYTPKYKQIWIMYFIEKRDIEEIRNVVNYSRENVNKIVYKLKVDLCDLNCVNDKRKKEGNKNGITKQKRTN